MDESFGMISASISDRGLSEKRPQNEDSFLEIPGSGIFAVADGVGGAQAGEVASQMAMEILGEAFNNYPTNADAEDVMRIALERANGAIFQMSNELSQLSKMATTVVALHLSGNIATIGHVGDSRLYRLDESGRLTQETEDHSMVADEVRAGRMTHEQAENHPGKNIINRALGAEDTVEVDLKTTMIDSGSTFLLCSDGVTRHINDSEITELLSYDVEPGEICSRIKDLCYERGAEDNLTAVVVRVRRPSNLEAEITPAFIHETPFEEADTLKFRADEEPTVASARPQWSAAQNEGDDDDELLELDTVETTFPVRDTDDQDVLSVNLPVSAADPIFDAPLAEEEAESEEPEFEEETLSSFHIEEIEDDSGSLEVIPDAKISEPQAPPPTPAAAPDSFSMFGNSGDVETSGSSRGGSSLGKIVTSVGMLLIGSIIGLGAYHFFLRPAIQPDPMPITEMRSANTALASFEELRRNVDNDPAGYIAKFGATPEDCEDHYLLGRAYLLTGDYVRARAALMEARNRLGGADPGNAKTLSVDIATFIAITNDTTIQNILKKEIDATKPPSANANR